MAHAETTVDIALLDRITGGAPKPVRGKMGDKDYCDALDRRWMAYRELNMTKQQRRVEAAADRCFAAWLRAFDAAVPRR
jgi:hypothetical protein